MVSQATPLDFGFSFALWTRDLVRQLIFSQFQVTMSISAVGALLHRIGLSVQRPLWRAWQQDAPAVRVWKEETFPAIAQAARGAGGTVYFGDEAGLRSDFHAGTTWAPTGITPVVATSGSRSSINMVSAVSAAGAMRWATYSGSFTGASFVDFLKKLARDTPGPVFLIVDNHSVHRAKVVREYLESTGRVPAKSLVWGLGWVEGLVILGWGRARASRRRMSVSKPSPATRARARHAIFACPGGVGRPSGPTA